jgi:cytochrome c oxidase subunit 1
VFFNLVFFPMHYIGMQGHMRRIYDPTQYEFLKPLQPINEFMTISALLLGASQLLFVANFVWTLARAGTHERNPWRANTLEWTTESPAPHGNWDVIPTVYRGPYEYSVPGVSEDYLPQDRPGAGTPSPLEAAVLKPTRA